MAGWDNLEPGRPNAASAPDKGRLPAGPCRITGTAPRHELAGTGFWPGPSLSQGALPLSGAAVARGAAWVVLLRGNGAGLGPTTGTALLPGRGPAANRGGGVPAAAESEIPKALAECAGRHQPKLT